MELPRFKYHPDPVATGSIKKSAKKCRCCGQATGYIYAGPVYSEDDLEEALCPWCIESGRAHEEFDAEFVSADGVGGYGDWDEVPAEVIQEVVFRTPGFAGWQEPRWFTCCGDAAAFLGAAGHDELSGEWAGAVPAIRAECGLAGDDWEEYFESLSKDDSPTAYIFRCLHCGRLGGYSDCD